jgi:hypothetical protein
MPLNRKYRVDEKFLRNKNALVSGNSVDSHVYVKGFEK